MNRNDSISIDLQLPSDDKKISEQFSGLVFSGSVSGMQEGATIAGWIVLCAL